MFYWTNGKYNLMVCKINQFHKIIFTFIFRKLPRPIDTDRLERISVYVMKLAIVVCHLKQYIIHRCIQERTHTILNLGSQHSTYINQNGDCPKYVVWNIWVSGNKRWTSQFSSCRYVPELRISRYRSWYNREDSTLDIDS